MKKLDKKSLENYINLEICFKKAILQEHVIDNIKEIIKIMDWEVFDGKIRNVEARIHGDNDCNIYNTRESGRDILYFNDSYLKHSKMIELLADIFACLVKVITGYHGKDEKNYEYTDERLRYFKSVGFEKLNKKTDGKELFYMRMCNMLYYLECYIPKKIYLIENAIGVDTGLIREKDYKKLKYGIRKNKKTKDYSYIEIVNRIRKFNGVTDYLYRERTLEYLKDKCVGNIEKGKDTDGNFGILRYISRLWSTKTEIWENIYLNMLKRYWFNDYVKEEMKAVQKNKYKKEK